MLQGGPGVKTARYAGPRATPRENMDKLLTALQGVPLIGRTARFRTQIVFTRKDYVDVELRVPSVTKARQMLGFEAKVDLEEGILRTAEHYRHLQADRAA